MYTNSTGPKKSQTDQGLEKLQGLLFSRKFWASLLGLLVSLGLLQLTDAQQAELVGAILTVASTLGYSVSVALEDGLQRRR